MLGIVGLMAIAAIGGAEGVVEKVQGFYEKTRSFSATFRQVYTYKVYKRKQISSGRVYFKKPGLMRWDYLKPTKKEFVADGKTLWIYQADENQVTEQEFRADRLSSSVSFLWGKGKLAEEFDIKAGEPLGGLDVLELVPKKSESHFKKLYFHVDRETGRVMKTIVFDPVGNTNEMTFSRIEENPALKPSLFTFRIPKNANVIRNP
ncbi:MAG: outer membrane lipoprotein chaperone LolA [Deltaproteobacteria bacterium]|nr:outer membrane lipoprotein chaperone LolA [Deltaproteobacteria bacterium]